MNRIFLLSPASTRGKRAMFLLRPEAEFELASRLKRGTATLGEVFTFLSGLYFRGKFVYARTFSPRKGPVTEGLVITPGQGVVPVGSLVDDHLISGFSQVDVDLKNRAYIQPLIGDLHELREKISSDTQVVLLGSIATGKYVEPLLEVFSSRLFFPKAFRSLGDMSRGSMMLRAAKTKEELEYQSLYPHGVHKRHPKNLIRP